MEKKIIKAQLADGRVLEFPEGTEDSVIDATVKKEMDIPEGGSMPISTLGAGEEPPTMRIGPPVPPAPTTEQKPLGERILEEVPQVGGGIVGGVAAGTTGAGLLPVVAAVALGAGTGEAYKQLGQHLSGSLDAPKTSIDAAKRIGKAGLTEGGWEMVGGLVMKGFGKIIAPLKNKMVKEGADAIDMFHDKIKPVVLLPAEATESRVLDLLQNVSESSIVGGSSIQDFKTQRMKFFDDFADSLIDEFGKRTDTTDLGNLFVASISNARAVHSKAANILYNSVKAGRAKTEIGSLKRFAKPLQRRAVKLEGIEAKNAGDDLLDAVMDLPDKLSYKEATELRSRLISRINEFSILNKKAPAIGKAKKMVGLLDKAIGKSLKGIGVLTTKVGPIRRKGIRVVDSSTISKMPQSVYSTWATKENIELLSKGVTPVKKIRHGGLGGVIVLKEETGEPGLVLISNFKGDLVKKLRKQGLDVKSYGSYKDQIDKIIKWQSEKFGKEVQFPIQTTKDTLRAEGFITGILDSKGKLIGQFDLGGVDLRMGTKAEGTVNLLNFEIYPPYREQGVASSFLEQTAEIARDKGYNKIVLTTEKERAEDLVRLYKKSGFKVDKVLPDGKVEMSMDLTKGEIGVPTSPAGPTPYEAWRTANRFYRDGQKKFNSTLIRRLVKLADDTGTGAEMIAPAIFKPRHISTVRKVKIALLGSPTGVPHGRIFYRGEGKHLGRFEKMIDGVDTWVGTKKTAELYGTPKKIIAKPGTKILNESDLPEIRRLMNRKGKNIFEIIGHDDVNKFFSLLIKKAKKEGYHALKFADEEAGIAVFDKSKFTPYVNEGTETWRKLQGFFMQHILQKSTDTSGDIIGRKLINNISGKPGSFGIPIMKEVFTEPQIKALRTFGKAVQLTQERQAEGAGRVLIQLTQAGALGAILTGNLALPAATVIIAPAVMSKMLLNPKVAKLLTTGLALPAKSPEAAGILTRLVAAAWRIQYGDGNGDGNGNGNKNKGEYNETIK